MKLQTFLRLKNNGEMESKKVLHEDHLEEVVTIHSVFFKKPYDKQRLALRMVIWWSIKHYIKILFK